MDIASRAGVSKGAVSYALNGRPGVSDETRERIVAIARELGWYPNRAARALSAARADAFGLVLARPATTIALEPFFMQFLAGVERELWQRGRSASRSSWRRRSRTRSRSTAAGTASTASTACSSSTRGTTILGSTPSASSACLPS